MTKMLSITNGNVLIKFGLSSIPSHIMQCTYVTASICKDLDKLNKIFWGGSTNEIRKLNVLN